MRRKRSARKKKMRKKALYQTASLISIAAFGIAQVIPSSNAVFSHAVSIKDAQITSSFVFPETIEGIVDEIRVEMEKVQAAMVLADSIYGSIKQAETSEQAINANSLDEVLKNANVAQENAIKKLNELNIYQAKAMLEAQEDESALKIQKIIEDAVKTATKITESMATLINEMKGIENQATIIISTMIQKEAAALEKEMIAELANKALEGLTNSNTLASEILAKYGAEFDLTAFQALTDELAKTETDLQSALEDAEKYLNELKGYVDGTKEVTSPDVVEEAKQNFEKVQQAIDSLKQTMENTKTTNSEVQLRIEQEKQRQEEEAKKIQQELQNQNPPETSGGGAPSAETPRPVEDNPNTPPTEVPNPGEPATGGGGTPNPDIPPANAETPNPNIPPANGDQTNPDSPPTGNDQTTPEPTQDGNQNTNQPARPEDENPDLTDQTDDENTGPEPDDPALGSENNDPNATETDETVTDSEITKEEETQTDTTTKENTQTEAQSSEQETTGNNENTTAAEVSSASSSDFSQANGPDQSTKNNEPTSMSESISRETVASLNIVNNEKNTYLMSYPFINRRDEEYDDDLIYDTEDFISQEIESQVVTLNNSHQVKINIRTYL